MLWGPLDGQEYVCGLLDSSLLWGPQDGRGYVALLTAPTLPWDHWEGTKKGYTIPGVSGSPKQNSYITLAVPGTLKRGVVKKAPAILGFPEQGGIKKLGREEHMEGL